jgi:cytochrome c biogenesis protein CcdA
MKRDLKNVLKSFSIELPVYAGLVLGYFFLVLHFMGAWLFHLFQQERGWYAAMALILIVVQGFVLEALTRLLLKLIRRNRRE